jgi:membrane protease YdiL (CAAX protease family)
LSRPLSFAERTILIFSLVLAVALGSWVFSGFDPAFWIRIVAFSSVMFCIAILLLGRRARAMVLGPLSLSSALALGVVSALAFYALAFAGFKILSALLPDAADRATSVYAAASGVPPLFVTVSLLAIALLEEFYWRGWATTACVRLFPAHPRAATLLGLLLVAAAYSIVHIFAGNPLLVLIAFLAALFWGALYLRFRSLLVTITSHFLWDLLIFQILPLARPN